MVGKTAYDLFDKECDPELRKRLELSMKENFNLNPQGTEGIERIARLIQFLYTYSIEVLRGITISDDFPHFLYRHIVLNLVGDIQNIQFSQEKNETNPNDAYFIHLIAKLIVTIHTIEKISKKGNPNLFLMKTLVTACLPKEIIKEVYS